MDLFFSCYYLLCREHGGWVFFFCIYIFVGNLFIFASRQEDLFSSISGFRCFRVPCFGCCPFSLFCIAYPVFACALFLRHFRADFSAYSFCFDRHPVFGGVCLHTFLILLPFFSFLFSPYFICSMDNFGKTVTVQPPPPP